MFNSEVNLHKREEQVEEHIKNITVSTNSLVISIRNVSEDINRLITADADLFKTLEDLMKRESTSMSTLQKIATTLDRLTVVSSEYHSLTTQTTLLLHSLEKAHSLVQSGVDNIVDVARLPLEAVDKVLSNHIKVSLQSASVEFAYTNTGYNVRYQIPRLSEPYIMYSIKHVPLFKDNIWLTLNLKEIFISNSVSDILRVDEVEKKCYNTHTYYICSPKEVEITHSERSCELQLREGYWGNSVNYSSCSIDHIVTKPLTQRSIINGNWLTLSSSIEDQLNYICDNPERDKVEPIPIGVKLFKVRSNCIYESKYLTIYNSLKSNIIQSDYSEGADREINLISAFTELQSQLDDFMDANGFNLSYDQIINLVHKEGK